MKNQHPKETFHTIIGQALNPSEWLLIDQPRINLFADATDDHQYIHTDPKRAATTELGGTIAHGLLSLSLLPALVGDVLIVPEGMTMGINYGFNNVRFLTPVRPCEFVRAVATVNDVVEKSPGRFLVTLNLSLEIQGQSKPAMVCEWLNLFVTSPTSASAE